jgi:ubiquinone biosynthesis monooxygenase Coq7
MADHPPSGLTPPRRPGERQPDRTAMLRVDQAGEFGAGRIYAGQLAVMGERHRFARLIRGMAAQEDRHRRVFDRLAAERGVRPTLLTPLWNVAGYALGAATALMGPRAAMACTAAIETEIDRHYAAQLDELGDTDPELSGHIATFQAEELEHRDTALANQAEEAPGYPLLSAAIRAGCRAAIALSKRI